MYANIDKVRAAITALGSLSVQNIGSKVSQQYVIRVSDDGKSADFSNTVPSRSASALDKAFGAGRVVAVKTDYVGPKFAKDLAGNVWKLTLLTVFAILVYSAVRFKLEYAIGAVVAILHDALIMITFMVWTRMEFSSMSIAAILTILGYSINDTIVIFDRIREDRTLNPTDSLVTVINKAITETLGRTIITTLTTALAVVALILFTSGDIHYFAIALIVGMISGTYSTIYMASAFIILWNNFKEKRKNTPAKPKIAIAPKAVPAK
jgi:preprotein translocase subunit SecF